LGTPVSIEDRFSHQKFDLIFFVNFDFLITFPPFIKIELVRLIIILAARHDNPKKE